MQYCRYENCQNADGIREEKARLLDREFLTQAQLDAVPEEKLLRFFRSELGELVLRGGEVRREFKFSVFNDASEYYPVESGQRILFQGVVDCFVITKDGIVVLDFKTDRLTPGQEQERAEYYAPQITAYSQALERIYSVPVIRRVLYFFSTDTACEV